MVKTDSGFSLIELMITVGVASILIALVAPGMQQLIARMQLSTERDILWHHIMVARSEAIKRGHNITLCKSADGMTCSTDNSVDWTAGWLIWSDDNDDGEVDSSERVEIKRPSNSQVEVTVAVDSLTYDQQGFLTTQNGTTFNFCHEGASPLGLSLNGIGRPSLVDSGGCQ